VLVFCLVINRCQHYALLQPFFDQGTHLFTNIYQRSKNQITMQHQGLVAARAGWIPFDEAIEGVKRTE
jgi:hypothetical protein